MYALFDQTGNGRAENITQKFTQTASGQPVAKSRSFPKRLNFKKSE
jgi:hypothetical protein